MKGLRIVGISALLLGGGLFSYFAFAGIEENLVYFLTVDELLDKGPSAYNANVRLGGVVKEGTHKFDHDSLDLEFEVAADHEGGRSILVNADGAPPQMFREGIGAIVEGKFDGKVFDADRVIVKHSNEYSPPEEGEHPEGVARRTVDDYRRPQ